MRTDGIDERCRLQVPAATASEREARRSVPFCLVSPDPLLGFECWKMLSVFLQYGSVLSITAPSDTFLSPVQRVSEMPSIRLVEEL
mmetsp:Transcript_36570/g.91056  ORF Transcript_36570/g.91056 Transcript_36570/m.91056 type:complete len:86 (+) Transcript_36570:802-1059(+)